MNQPKKVSIWTVLAGCFAVCCWIAIGIENVYSTGQHTYDKPAEIESFKAPVLRSKKIRAGLYTAEAIQPLTLNGKRHYANVIYMIASINNGKDWSASRTAVVDGSSIDLGVDVFPTKKKALWYISTKGRYIDYGNSPNLKVMYR